MMYVIIAGINPVGRKLVERLESAHDIVAIDADEDSCERLYSSSTATVINKDPTSIQALEDAGVTKADVIISALETDNENMVVCSLAKKYGVDKVVSRVQNDEYMEAFQVIGAETVAHTDLLLSEFLSAVEHPYFVKIADLSNEREVLKAKVREDSSLEGKLGSKLKDDKGFPEGFKLASVVKEEETVSGEPEVEMSEGDTLILIGPESQKQKLNRYFERQR